jgi:hypothetical protein
LTILEQIPEDRALPGELAEQEGDEHRCPSRLTTTAAGLLVRRS